MTFARFGRKVALRVGIPLNPPFETVGGVGREWSDLRIEFDVEKTLKREPNTAKIRLFNPDEISIGYIQSIGAFVQLYVGHGLALPSLLFSGNVSDRGVVVKREGPDTIVEIECGDGEKTFQNSDFNWAFEGPTPNNVILPLALAAMGAGLGAGAPTLPTVVYSSPVFMGKARRTVDRLVEDAGATWSLQDGNVEILLTETQTLLEEVVLLTPETGLIGTPEPSDKGMNIVGLIDGRVRPGKAVSVISSTASGLYRASRVVYSGDNWSGDFSMKIEATEIAT